MKSRASALACRASFHAATAAFFRLRNCVHETYSSCAAHQQMDAIKSEFFCHQPLASAPDPTAWTTHIGPRPARKPCSIRWQFLCCAGSKAGHLHAHTNPHQCALARVLMLVCQAHFSMCEGTTLSRC